MGKNQYVVPHNGKWAVRGENNTRVTSIHDTKAEAMSAGRKIAMNQKSELRPQKRNGQFQNPNSYGNDPCPPRDKKH